MQGARILRNEAYSWYAAMTKDEVQHSRMTFYEAGKIKNPSHGNLLPGGGFLSNALKEFALLLRKSMIVK